MRVELTVEVSVPLEPSRATRMTRRWPGVKAAAVPAAQEV
jgi:hypothetical protein